MACVMRSGSLMPPTLEPAVPSSNIQRVPVRERSHHLAHSPATETVANPRVHIPQPAPFGSVVVDSGAIVSLIR